MRFLLAALTMLTLLASPQPEARADEPLRLQLKWEHQFQFAGYYAALEQGYYRDAGLEVEILPAVPGQDAVVDVLAGKAEFGVGTSELVLARAKGAPVVVLAAIFQHSPLVLLAPRAGQIQTLHDLAGKPVAIEAGSAELFAYLAREGLDEAELRLVEHDHDIEQLVSGAIVAQSAYVTTEPHLLQQRGIEYQMYSPRAVGIDFYGDNLFTTEALIEANPERVRAFRDASLRGWAYAMAHPAEVIELIVERHGSRRSRAALEFEADHMQQLVRADVVEPGHMLTERWRHIADIFVETGMLERGYSLDGFVYDLDTEPQAAQPLLSLPLAGSLLLILVASGVALQFMSINRRLKLSEERYRSVYHAAPLAFIVTDLEHRIVEWNEAAERMFGWWREEVLGRDLYEILIPADVRDYVGERIADVLARKAYNQATNEIRTKDGRKMLCEWHNVPYLDSSGKRAGVLSIGADVTARDAAERQLRFLAQHDMLTELPNRILFDDRLEHALAAARRSGQRLAVMFIDLDRFKPINDLYGHATGDLLLKEAAARMSATVREMDTVARIGGDEFVMVLPDVVDAAAALAVAEKVREAMARPFDLEGLEFSCSCSIGIALYPDHGDDSTTLARCADDAMYRAKNEGRNRALLASSA